MRSYSTATIAAITTHLFRLQSLLEQIGRECGKDHREIMELIQREMKVAVDALQPTSGKSSVTRANRDEPFHCPNCQSDAIQVVTLGPTENEITVRCDDCDQYIVVVFKSEPRDVSSSTFVQKNNDDPSC